MTNVVIQQETSENLGNLLPFILVGLVSAWIPNEHVDLNGCSFVCSYPFNRRRNVRSCVVAHSGKRIPTAVTRTSLRWWFGKTDLSVKICDSERNSIQQLDRQEADQFSLLLVVVGRSDWRRKFSRSSINVRRREIRLEIEKNKCYRDPKLFVSRENSFLSRSRLKFDRNEGREREQDECIDTDQVMRRIFKGFAVIFVRWHSNIRRQCRGRRNSCLVEQW